MGKPAAVPPSIAEVAQSYVSSWQRQSIVSTADAIWTIRYTVPHCEHTDEQRAGIVALLAVSQGRDVAFDHLADGWQG